MAAWARILYFGSTAFRDQSASGIRQYLHIQPQENYMPQWKFPSSWSISLISIFGPLWICRGSILGIGVRPGVCTRVAEPASLPLGKRLPLCICISHLCIASFSNARGKGEEHMGIGKACYNLPKSPEARTANALTFEKNSLVPKWNKTKQNKNPTVCGNYLALME